MQQTNEGKITKEQIVAAGIPLLGTLGLEIATHNPEVLAFGLIGSLACGRLAPVVREVFASAFIPDPDQTIDTTKKIMDALPVEDNSGLPQDHLSKIKRILNIKPREEQAQPKDEREPLIKRAQKQQQQQPFIVPQFLLDEALGDIRSLNKKGRIYFGDVISGAFSLDMAEMYHVLDVSSSGKGKSNRFRLAMMQLVDTCEVYYINPLANAIKAVKDERKIEVWTPIFERLANEKPIKEASEIRVMMNALLKQIQARNEQEAQNDFSWLERPIFVFIDELPEVFSRCPEAIEMLDKIVRTGRNYLVFAYVASQSAAVADIGQNTASQAQYKTRVYGGGDKNSSNRMMKGALPPDIERLLQSSGAGLTVMLAAELEDLAYVRAPLVTNEALFEYFHLPPFQLNEWLPSQKKGAPVKQNLLADLSPDLLPSTFSSKEKEAIQAQNVDSDEGKRVKGKRVKGPNHDAILEAMDELEGDSKALTMNAIARKAGLTRHQYDEIEEVAAYYGYDLVAGKGRPAERG